jgi:hypothetical protein
MQHSEQDLTRKYKQDTGLDAYSDGEATPEYVSWLQEELSSKYDKESDLNKSDEFTKIKRNDIMK